MPQTEAHLITGGEIVGFKNFDLKLSNTFNKVAFVISSDDTTVDEVLKNTLGLIKQFDLQATAKGELKNLNIDIRSSLAGDLEKSFQALLQNKIKEAQEKLQQAVNSEIEKLKTQLNSQITALKSQTEGEIKKIKKEAEDQAKSKVQQEGQKQLDDLKKKLGL